MEISPKIIEKAYYLRLYRSKRWAEIAEICDVPSEYHLKNAILRHVRANNLIGTAQKNLNLGVKTYELRRKGYEFGEIAALLGFKKHINSRGMQLMLIARSYAKRAHREWPPF